MRFSVECAFPHLGKRRAASRKSALCDPQVAQTAPFRHAAAPGRCGATPRQAAGHYGECLNWANALEQPPASLRGGLCQGPQISVRSLALRKGALCPTCGLQNAPFRRMRFSSPGQTSSHLTEKRTLQPTQPQQCTQMPQNGSEKPLSPICVHSLSPRPLVRLGRATGPTTSMAPWPHDARTLGPEAHAAAATQPPTHTSSRSQAPLSTYGRRHICAARRSSRCSLP